MRNRFGWKTLAVLVCCFGSSQAAFSQTLAPPFDLEYSVSLLGSVPGVPTNYGGLTFLRDDPDIILIGGSANQSNGLLYAIQVVRGEDRHILGFEGTASVFATAAYNDGGIVYGPSGVLFMARWPVNELGQLKPGSQSPDKIIPMTPFDVPTSLSALAFVPGGFPGTGRLKLVTYGSGDWFDAQITADGNGTFDLVNVTHRVQIPGGPEGFVYLPPSSPRFADFSSILVAEYSFGSIAAYTVGDDGDPVPGTRVDFLTGLSGAEGAVVDPLTGDFLFSTFGGFNQVVAVRGFGTPGACNGSDANCTAFADACHDAVCDPESDLCVQVAREDGTACDDGSSCANSGHCAGGECVEQFSCFTAPGCSDTCDLEQRECRTCGHPVRNDRCIVNAVVVLHGALDLRPCEPCICDVDSSGAVTATDALLVLRSCAGLSADLQCGLPAQ